MNLTVLRLLTPKGIHFVKRDKQKKDGQYSNSGKKCGNYSLNTSYNTVNVGFIREVSSTLGK